MSDIRGLRQQLWEEPGLLDVSQYYKLHSLIGSFTVALELIHSNIGGIRQSAYNLIFLVETTQ